MVVSDPLATVLQELTSARKIVKRSRNRQIRNREDRDILSATAFAWFQSHHKRIPAAADQDLLEQADAAYRTILDATAKNSAKSTYLEAMDSAREALIGLRTTVVSMTGTAIVETAPDFTPLVGDATMRGILERRWDECQVCLGAVSRRWRELGRYRDDGRTARGFIRLQSEQHDEQVCLIQSQSDATRFQNEEADRSARLDAGAVHRCRPRTEVDYEVWKGRCRSTSGLPQLHPPGEGAQSRNRAHIPRQCDALGVTKNLARQVLASTQQ